MPDDVQKAMAEILAFLEQARPRQLLLLRRVIMGMFDT